MAAVLGKLLGIDQAKALEALPQIVKDLLGGLTVEEFAQKLGLEHQVAFDLAIEDNKLKGRIWVEDRTREGEPACL
jgi:hypothetical protein